jgi:beta-glucosidase
LKNDGILPLDRTKIHTIGVIGPNADSRSALIGNYHGTASRYITVLEGIEDVAGDAVRVMYSQGCHLFRDRVEPLAKAGDRLMEAVTVAEHSDVVVLCLGLDETLEGEEGDTGNAYSSGDKPDLSLPKAQQELLENVIRTGKPVILCVMSGSALDLNYADAHASAILQTWYPGAKGGKTVAQILFGEVQPSGKLPVTFYKDLSGLPDFTDYSMKGRTYRYLKQEPLYPFGFGLTYGKAVVTELTAEKDDTGATLQIKVENQGTVPVDEVLQVYVHVDGSEDEVPNPKLAAFQRIHLDVGEHGIESIRIPKEAFSTIDENGNRQWNGTGAHLYAGFGQPDARTQKLGGWNGKLLEMP